MEAINRQTSDVCTVPSFCGGADKSLARPTSPCRRTELMVSLERGVCSCAELQVFSYNRSWKEACQATHAIATTSRRELSSSFFPPARQSTEGNSRHSDRNIREHASSYAAVKNWVAQFKRGDLSTCVAPRPRRPKTMTTPEIIDQIHELILEDSRISAKSIAEQLGISRERVGSTSFMKIWTCGSSPRNGSRNAWKRGSKTSTVPVVWANFGFFSARSKWFPIAIGDLGRNLVISLWPGDKATINGMAA